MGGKEKIKRREMRRNKSAYRLSKRGSFAFWVTLALFLGYWWISGQSSRDITLYSYWAPDEASWITSKDNTQYKGCLRKNLRLTSEVKHAYISVTAEGGFELLVNGDPVGAQTLWRPTRHFQNGLTESGQRLTSTEPTVVYNFPREYQWSGHSNNRVLVHFDLRPFLKRGDNTIALEIEGRQAQPAAIAFGKILLKDGTEVKLQTDGSWRAEPTPKGLKRMDWFNPEVSINHWARAVKSERFHHKKFVSGVPPNLYTTHHETAWVRPDSSNNALEFKASFQAQDVNTDAWLRMTSLSPYWIWINGERLGVNRSKKRGFNGAEWVLSWEGRRPLAALPVLLDPDEVSGFFGGERYQNPRHGDPTQNDFKKYENTQNRTSERPNQIVDGTLDDRGDLDESSGRSQDPYGYFEEPNTAVPHALLRQLRSAQHHGYDIRQFLRKGENTIRVRLVDERAGRVDTYDGSQSLKFALSGQVGERALQDLAWTDALRGEEVSSPPALQYLGGASRGNSIGVYALPPLLFCVFWLLGTRFYFLKNFFLIFSLTLLAGLLLEIGFAERSEWIWMQHPYSRFGLLFVATLLGLLQMICSSFKVRTLRGRSTYVVVAALLLLTFGLRIWKADFQPIDDDEYASIQAVLSIVETGQPLIAEDIWYSRSPGYHYLCAAFAKVFGSDILILRLYSVLFALMTGALLWGMARQYFKNTWIAHVALLIFAIHPFLIFSGHIARFYQQQQFFVLLMLHLFVMGFLHKPTQWARVGAILAFMMAVISQEISNSFVPVFIVLYLLFGRGVPFKWEFKAVLYIIFAGLVIFADVAFFQVKCLTRSVGVSPNVEATLAPTFWELGNLFSMFIGYSRLHLVISVFYLMSLAYSIRRRSSLFLTLHVALLLSVVLFNFLITSVSFRYMYSLIPLWILLSAHGIRLFGVWVNAHLIGGSPSYRSVSMVSWAALVCVVISFSPWRILDSYDKKLLGDPISALEYVREHLRAEDKIMITEPHPHAAKIELGRVDYDLVVPILYDFTYQDLSTGGSLRDRNGNSLVVNRLAQLQQIFKENKRMWIILNREKFRSRKKNIRWEYPGAREELFIRQNCDLKYSAYLWDVYLWDAAGGEYEIFRAESNQWVE